MKSMTGFGRGTAGADGTKVCVEASSVNSRKQPESRVNLPRELAMLEPEIRQTVSGRVHRGMLTLSVTYELNPAAQRALIRIDRDLLLALASDLRDVAREAGLAEDLALRDLLAVPGVIGTEMTMPSDLLGTLACDAAAEAMDGLEQMRCTEGAQLHRDLEERIGRLRLLAADIRSRADEALVRHRERLLERVRILGLDLKLDDERLAKEVAFHAERSDIAEEITRLDSHLDQFDGKLGADGEVGRALEFLCQEMGREISTIGSKARETSIAEVMLAFKAELSKVREQVMNVE